MQFTEYYIYMVVHGIDAGIQLAEKPGGPGSLMGTVAFQDYFCGGDL